MEKKKINLFQDKEYEGLDWLSKAVEPFVFPLNDIIAKIPDCTTFTYDDVVRFIETGRSMDFTKSLFLGQILKKEDIEVPSADDMDTISNLMSVSVPNGLSVDFENQRMDGTFCIKKNKSQMEDDDIREHINNKTRRILSYIRTDDVNRLNAIMDVMNCKEARQSKSIRNKRDAIISEFSKIVREDTWRIRDVELAIKCAEWMRDYINNGNLASLSNFTRIKCMTHKRMSIYSMEETV